MRTAPPADLRPESEDSLADQEYRCGSVRHDSDIMKPLREQLAPEEDINMIPRHLSPWLSGLAVDDAQQLWDYVVGELIDLKFRPDRLESFIKKSGLPLAA